MQPVRESGAIVRSAAVSLAANHVQMVINGGIHQDIVLHQTPLPAAKIGTNWQPIIYDVAVISLAQLANVPVRELHVHEVYGPMAYCQFVLEGGKDPIIPIPLFPADDKLKAAYAALIARLEWWIPHMGREANVGWYEDVSKDVVNVLSALETGVHNAVWQWAARKLHVAISQPVMWGDPRHGQPRVRISDPSTW